MRAVAVLPFGYEPTFGQRLGGALIDALVLLPAAALLNLLPGRFATTGRLVVSAAYVVLLTAERGQTLGKRVMGTRVVDVHTGALPTLRSAGLRWGTVIAASVLVAVAGLPGGLEELWVLLVLLPVMQPPRHRGLHDRLAGTLVVSPRPRGPV